MPEKKRIYPAEAHLVEGLRLEPVLPPAGREKTAETLPPRKPERTIFPPELIARLAERIKKL